VTKKGPPKKSVDLVALLWLVVGRGSEAKKGQRTGVGLFFSVFFWWSFELPSPPNKKRPKTKTGLNKTEKIGFGFFVDFFVKFFDTICFVKRFLWCFFTPIAEKPPKTR
jgi:hypothetical protein